MILVVQVYQQQLQPLEDQLTQKQLQNLGMALLGLKQQIQVQQGMMVDQVVFKLLLCFLVGITPHQDKHLQKRGMVPLGQKQQIQVQQDIVQQEQDQIIRHYSQQEETQVQLQQQKNGIKHLPLLLVHGHQEEIITQIEMVQQELEL